MARLQLGFSDIKTVDDVDIVDTWGKESVVSRSSAIDPEQIKTLLGPDLFEKLQRIEEKHLAKISELEAENKALRATVIKPAPAPTSETPIKTLKDLRVNATSLSSYKDIYYQAESSGNTSYRLRLHAFLSNVDDLVELEKSLKRSPKEYYSSAISNIPRKMEIFTETANAQKKSLAQYINENI